MKAWQTSKMVICYILCVCKKYLFQPIFAWKLYHIQTKQSLTIDAESIQTQQHILSYTVYLNISFSYDMFNIDTWPHRSFCYRINLDMFQKLQKSL